MILPEILPPHDTKVSPRKVWETLKDCIIQSTVKMLYRVIKKTKNIIITKLKIG